MTASLTPPSPPRTGQGVAVEPTSLRPVPPDPALEATLVALVADGTLAAEQAHAVRATRARLLVTATVPDDVSSLSTTAAPEQVGDTHPARHGPLPEILGYVGAALVGSALLNLVAQSWETWSQTVRLTLVCSGTAVLYLAAVTVAASSGWRRGLAEGSAIGRRLVALLLAVGAVFAGLTATVALDAAGFGSASWVPLVCGAITFTAAMLGAWLVRGVLSTLAVAAGSVWLVGGVWAALGAPDWAWYLPVGFAAVGLAWLAVAPRLLAVPVLCEALGWAFLVMSLMPLALWMPPTAEEGFVGDQAVIDATLVQAWVSRGLLVGLAALGMSVLLRGGRWPWAAGGIASGVVAALAIGGQTLNWIMAMLLAGVVLLLLSGVLVVLRRRGSRAGAGTPTVGSSV